jgi:hypothetical protein
MINNILVRTFVRILGYDGLKVKSLRSSAALCVLCVKAPFSTPRPQRAAEGAEKKT